MKILTAAEMREVVVLVHTTRLFIELVGRAILHVNIIDHGVFAWHARQRIEVELMRISGHP